VPRQGVKTADHIIAKIRMMATAGLSAREIRDRLSTDPAIGPDDFPEDRTIQRYRRIYAPKTGKPWSAYQDWRDRPDDARIVLTVLRELTWASRGRKRFLTMDEAGAVLFVSRVAPQLPPLVVWTVATEYLTGEAGPLDQFLAFHTPDDPKQDWAGRYQMAKDNRWVDPGVDIMIDFPYETVFAGPIDIPKPIVRSWQRERGLREAARQGQAAFRAPKTSEGGTTENG